MDNNIKAVKRQNNSMLKFASSSLVENKSKRKPKLKFKLLGCGKNLTLEELYVCIWINKAKKELSPTLQFECWAYQMFYVGDDKMISHDPSLKVINVAAWEIVENRI